MLSRFDFLIRDRPFFSGGGGGGAGADFSNSLTYFFIDKVKVFFVHYNCLQLLLGPIHLLNFSFTK